MKAGGAHPDHGLEHYTLAELLREAMPTRPTEPNRVSVALGVAWIVLLCIAPAAPALAAADDGVGARITRLRDARITIDERERLCGELLALGPSGAGALATLAAEQVERASKHAAKLEARYLKDFEKAALKLVDARSTKQTLAAVDEARAAVRKLRGKADLSKSDIEEVGDVAVAKLREVFEVTPEQVAEANAALAEQREQLSQAWWQASDWFETFQRAMRVLGDVKRVQPSDPTPRWDDVVAQEVWLCTLALPMSPGDRRTLLSNRELAPQIDAEEAAGVLDLNRLRLLLGLNAVAIDVKLCDASRDHSNDMRTLGFFAHESPVAGKKTPWDRAARFGTSAGAENIAAGQTTGAGANRAWWYSPGHHKNMLGGHARIGLGRSETHWTQMFG